MYQVPFKVMIQTQSNEQNLLYTHMIFESQQDSKHAQLMFITLRSKGMNKNTIHR